MVVAWGAFLRTGSISTLWPMLGIANQLLATTALCVGTTVIVNAGRARYAWVTLVPLAFVATTTLTAAYLSTVNNFLKLRNFQGCLDAAAARRAHGAAPSSCSSPRRAAGSRCVAAGPWVPQPSTRRSSSISHR